MINFTTTNPTTSANILFKFAKKHLAQTRSGVGPAQTTPIDTTHTMHVWGYKFMACM